MAQELTAARSALSKVSSALKSGQYISAAVSIRDGARLFKRITMIKNEADELIALLRTACDHMRYDREVSNIFPLNLTYTPGKEEDLARLMDQLIDALQEISVDDAIKKREEQKAASLARGRRLLEEGQPEEARQVFRQITSVYADDAELAAAVGEIYMQTNRFEEAYTFLVAAVKLKPNSALLLNRLGIVLRKIKKYSQAESVYKRALDLEPENANLFFNMARVYLEQEEYAAALDQAQKALEIIPDFTEAAKLRTYARKKLKSQT
jgi:Putative Zn-dependent protease, contains TPR repeats